MSTGEQVGSVPQPSTLANFWLKSALVIVVAGILLACVWMPSRSKEPVYQGKTLSEWVRVRAKTDTTEEEIMQSAAAIQKIGTNGFPTLLRMIQTPDSRFITKLKEWAENQRLIRFNLENAEDIRNLALLGFKMLGEDSRGAIPELVTLMKRTDRTNGREEIIAALGAIGPAAQATVPALLAIASDAQDPERVGAIRALGLIRSSADTVVPFLTSCLSDPRDSVRGSAASALSWFRRAAQSSVPVLIPLLSDRDDHVRFMAAEALRSIDPAAAAAAGVK